MNVLGMQMEVIELGLIIFAIIVVVCVLYMQMVSYKETKSKIDQLAGFFPNESSLKLVQSSITKDVLSSRKQLEKFIENPPARHIPEPMVLHSESDGDEEGQNDNTPIPSIKYADVDLIQLAGNTGSAAFKDVIMETNAYLCKNVGTSADFSVIQDICERKLESLEEQVANTINVPLYLGLAGTFVGIITGLLGIAGNIDGLFNAGNMIPLRNLLFGVVIAMVASCLGLGLMIHNSAVNYKNALSVCGKNKNIYYDFIRRELMPVLSNSMAASLNSLKGVLGEFIGKFGHNLDAYANSAELLNDNIEKQHLLLVEINKMDQTKVAGQIAETFNTLRDSSESLRMFQDYQNSLNTTIQETNEAVSKIETIIDSFDDFSKSLKVVVENQETAGKLQTLFQSAIETHFPTGAEAREMWRKQFDELTTDASTVSEELNEQLRVSTDYIKSFVQDNKDSFTSLARLKEILDSLVQYAHIQAECYKDLKEEIQNLKQARVKAQSDAAKLNADLLTAVKEMIFVVKTLKN